MSLLKKSLVKDLESYRRSAFYLKNHQRRHPKTALIAASLAHSGLEMAFCAARQCSFQTFKYQHGSLGYFQYPMLPYYNLINTDCWLAYGDGVKKSVEQEKKDAVRIVAVGSTALDALKATLGGDPAKRRPEGLPFRVVYAITNMSWNQRYAAHHMYEDSAYFAVQRAIVDVFKTHLDIHLMIKTHPNRSYPEDVLIHYIQDQKMPHCTIVRTGAFAELLKSADMIVIDSPTTTLLQSLTTTKPILIYNGVLRINDESVKLLRKRCTYSENLNEFLAALDTALREKKLEPSSTDNEFLRAYGTHRDDGLSARRALQEILSP